jgi:hypothetical protein
MWHLMVAMAWTDKGSRDCEFFYSPEKQSGPFNLFNLKIQHGHSQLENTLQ